LATVATSERDVHPTVESETAPLVPSGKKTPLISAGTESTTDLPRARRRTEPKEAAEKAHTLNKLQVWLEIFLVLF
jgi:hypothetical protein